MPEIPVLRNILLSKVKPKLKITKSWYNLYGVYKENYELNYLSVLKNDIFYTNWFSWGTQVFGSSAF